MHSSLPMVYLARHGETAWSLSGQHTGKTDLPLTERGEAAARAVGKRLNGITFARVFCSPRLRARRTCELAGFGAVAQIDEDLAEWDYGDYEGMTTAQIRQRDPDWQIFRDGCPGGESVAQISARADRMIARLRANGDNTLVFSSGHILRVIAARWLGMEANYGRLLYLATASVSILGYEHDLSEPALRLWNEVQTP